MLQSTYDVELATTRAPGEAGSLCRTLGNEVGFVAVLGGDGTINEVANGLDGSSVPLACLPGGLTNVFARLTGTPTRAVEAAERLASGQARLLRVDVGWVAGRRFLFSSGMGLSANLVRRQTTGPRSSRALSGAWVAWSALRAIANEHADDGNRVRVHPAGGGKPIEATSVVVQNADALTYLGPRPVKISEGGGLSTGTLSLAALGTTSVRATASLLPRVLSGGRQNVADHPAIKSLSPSLGAVVEALGDPMALEADGEFLGEHTRVEYSIDPGALRVLA